MGVAYTCAISDPNVSTICERCSGDRFVKSINEPHNTANCNYSDVIIRPKILPMYVDPDDAGEQSKNIIMCVRVNFSILSVVMIREVYA